jgi:hypothetical protein
MHQLRILIADQKFLRFTDQVSDSSNVKCLDATPLSFCVVFPTLGRAPTKALRRDLFVNVFALAERNRFPGAGQSPRLEKSGEMQHSKEWDHKRRDEHQG